MEVEEQQKRCRDEMNLWLASLKEWFRVWPGRCWNELHYGIVLENAAKKTGSKSPSNSPIVQFAIKFATSLSQSPAHT